MFSSQSVPQSLWRAKLFITYYRALRWGRGYRLRLLALAPASCWVKWPGTLGSCLAFGKMPASRVFPAGSNARLIEMPQRFLAPSNPSHRVATRTSFTQPLCGFSFTTLRRCRISS